MQRPSPSDSARVSQPRGGRWSREKSPEVPEPTPGPRSLPSPAHPPRLSGGADRRRRPRPLTPSHRAVRSQGAREAFLWPQGPVPTPAGVRSLSWGQGNTASGALRPVLGLAQAAYPVENPDFRPPPGRPAQVVGSIGTLPTPWARLEGSDAGPSHIYQASATL